MDSVQRRCVSAVCSVLQGELGDRHSTASESGSSTDSHIETCENKDGERGFLFSPVSMFVSRYSGFKRLRAVFSAVKKKFQFSNLMNIGKKKPLALESPDKCVDTSGEQQNTLTMSDFLTIYALNTKNPL